MPINNINNGDSGLSVRGIINSVIDFINNITKSDVGLGNVDNTSDANKPVSTATQTALNAKQDTITNTDSITEGSTNLFFTAARSVGSALTGFATAVVSASILATDTILVALGKIQKFMDDNIPSTMISISSDQPTTSGTAVDITDLVFPVAANKKYFIRGGLHVGSTTGGFKFATVLPSGATMFIEVITRNTVGTTIVWGPMETSGLLSGAVSASASSNAYVLFMGTVTVGSTAGNVQFQMASAVAGQTTTVYSEGSAIEIIPLS